MRYDHDRSTLALLILGFVAWILACSGGTPSGTASVQREPVFAALTAQQLFAAYEENEISADQRYTGKVVLIDGPIKDIGKDILGSPYLTLAAGEDSPWSVQAMFGKAAESRLAGLRKGQKVTVKCRVDGKMANVILKDCDLQ